MRLAALVCAAVAILSGIPAQAACFHGDPPPKYVQIDAGASDASLSKGNLPWREEFVQAQYREGNDHSYYLRAASDSRFGATDPNYEGGTYQKLSRNVFADVYAAFSPTHSQLPASTIGAGADVRMAHGYGIQASYAERVYTAQNVGISTIGLDRYAGVSHIILALTSAVVSNVPGTALSERAGYERYAGCDEMSFVVSAGRDVESTGVGSNVAVYQAYSYNARDTHWMNDHYAWQVGAGWDPLVGAYSRFEVRVALRGRF